MAAESEQDKKVVLLALALILAILVIGALYNFGYKPQVGGKVFDLARCGNEILEPEIGESCEVNNDTACPGNCNFDCTCAVCGNNQVDEDEECDGVFDLACPGQCQSNCKCPPKDSRVLTDPSRFTFFYDKIAADVPVTIVLPKQTYALRSFNLTAASNLTNARVIVDADITKPPAVIAPGEFVYSYFNIQLENPPQVDAITNAKFTFGVTKRWLERNNLDSNTVKLNRFTGNWNSLTTLNISEDKDYIYYRASSPGLSVYAVTAEKIPPPPAPPAPVCGNGILESGENTESCCSDTGCTNANESCINNRCIFVPRCGNQVCEPGENYGSCSQDCFTQVFFLPQFIVIFATLILASAAAIVFTARRKRAALEKRKPQKKESIMDKLISEEELIEHYIVEHLKKGFSETEIKNELKQVGWAEDLIEKILREVKTKI